MYSILLPSLENPSEINRFEISLVKDNILIYQFQMWVSLENETVFTHFGYSAIHFCRYLIFIESRFHGTIFYIIRLYL